MKYGCEPKWGRFFSSLLVASRQSPVARHASSFFSGSTPCITGAKRGHLPPFLLLSGVQCARYVEIIAGPSNKYAFSNSPCSPLYKYHHTGSSQPLRRFIEKILYQSAAAACRSLKTRRSHKQKRKQKSTMNNLDSYCDPCRRVIWPDQKEGTFQRASDQASDDVIAADLHSLTYQERQAITDEIHGVGNGGRIGHATARGRMSGTRTKPAAGKKGSEFRAASGAAPQRLDGSKIQVLVQ